MSLRRFAWLLAAAAFAGLAAWVLSGLVAARGFAYWKETMSALRTVGTAVESYSIDHGAYPACATIDELAMVLEPKYVRQLPRKDGWRRPILYRAWREEDGALVPGRPTDYAAWSAGRDGIAEHADPTSYDEGAITAEPRGFLDNLRNVVQRETREE